MERKSYQMARPAAPATSPPAWMLTQLAAPIDSLGRTGWSEIRFQFTPPSGAGFVLTGKKGTLTNRPMINPMFPFDASFNFHVVFRSRFYDTGKPCWIDGNRRIATISASLYF